ncbi:hypothetical protein ACQR1I_14545 [Bradyrhizobium sp. HKCCYLS2038]|uniref:hypothetical protein n=1 Tax=unclassified Bradyrhizobium TaxID=2631580 RepID=UPI003EB9058E
MELGQLIFDVAREVLIATMRLATLSGRMLYAAIGLAPGRDIMFLTGIGVWALIGTIAWAWLV